MSINPLIAIPQTALKIPAAVSSAQPGFQEALQKLTPEYAKRRKEAEQGAAGLVSAALILPILKQVRRSTFNKDGPFSPGIGEKAFGPQFDMQLADRIAHSPRMDVTKVLADRLMKRTLPPAARAASKELDIHG